MAFAMNIFTPTFQTSSQTENLPVLASSPNSAISDLSTLSFKSKKSCCSGSETQFRKKIALRLGW